MPLIRTVVLLLLLMPGTGVSAELAPSTLVIQPERIVLLPVRDASFTETSLFLDENQPQPIAIRTLETRLENVLKNTLTDFHNVERIPWKTLKSRVMNDPEVSSSIQVIEEHLKAGKSAYKNMDLPTALEQLDTASTRGMNQDLDILQPQLLGQIAFLKGLSLLEQGKTAQAHIAFKDAIHHEPHHGRIKGYFPTVVEEAMMAALQDLKTQQPPELQQDPRRLTNLLKRLNANQMLIPTLLGTGTQRFLRLVVFDRRQKDIVFRASLQLGSALEDQERIERAISRWRTCAIVETEGDTPPQKENRFHVNTNFTHGVFLAHPTRQPMQNLGLTLQAGWLALDNLEVSATFSSHFSLADSFGDQEGGMTSLRTSLGTAFVLRSNLWRVYLRPALEMHRIGRLRVITNAHCKFFGVEHPACPAGSVTDLDEAILWGLHAGMGASMNLGKHLQINLGIGFSGYLVSEESELNHFFTSELGIGYQF